MQGGDRAPAYPGIAGGMGLCESTLPQVGRALRPQEKGNDVGSLVYMGNEKGRRAGIPATWVCTPTLAHQERNCACSRPTIG